MRKSVEGEDKCRNVAKGERQNKGQGGGPSDPGISCSYIIPTCLGILPS